MDDERPLRRTKNWFKAVIWLRVDILKCVSCRRQLDVATRVCCWVQHQLDFIHLYVNDPPVPSLSLGGQAFPEFFSGCSVQQLSEFMERAQPGCLHRPVSVRTVAAGPLCGNALLDPGEECDCGTEEVKVSSRA